jgi:PAS domain S-box-containing protein
MKHETPETTPLSTLFLEDSLRDTELIASLLKESGYDLRMNRVDSLKEFTAMLRTHVYDVILSDFRLPGFDAFAALEIALAIRPDTPFICVSGTVGEETAIEIIKRGAVDYVTKDHLARLPIAINRARDEVRERRSRKQVEEKLSKSERRFRQLFDEAPVGYHELDVQGRIVEVNQTELEMLGHSAADMLHHGAWEFIVEEETSRRAIAAKIAGTMQLGGTHERTFRRSNGTTLNVLVNDRALRNEAGAIVGIRSTLQDITERKKAEQELRLMAQTVASAQDCISITDLKNRFLFVNEAFRKTYGYQAEELLGKDVAMVRPPLPATMTDRIFQETLEGEWHGEIMNRRKDESEFPVELWTSIVKDDGGVPVAIVGVARDITTRKRAEEHLRRSEEQFRLIAENVADMIAVVDLQGRRIYNSPSYRNTLGEPEALKGTDGFQEVHPEDRDRVRAVFHETVRTGVGQRMEYRLLGKDNAERNIESRGSVIRDHDGRVAQVIIVSRDVTEEKRLEAQFLRAQRMESIGTLAGGIAHDLNNVLAPIVMAIDVLRSKISDAGGQKILNTLETSAKRGSDIVRQVLAFGRGVKGDRNLVQLKHVVNEVVKIIEETFPKSIKIQIDTPRNLWTVSADPTQMHQVFLNILVNARDAMPRGGSLTVAATNVKLDEHYSRMHVEAQPGQYVCIEIVDTGTGIPADIREKIFEPFFTTKEIGVGTGLGLSTTLAIVKSHGGFIELDSNMGAGTTFRIYIPATGPATGAGEENGQAELPRGNGELVLVIDDEAAIREITVETLEAYGYRALSARDGAEGVAVYAEHKQEIRAVITDIMMPIMDGTATVLALKRINPHVRIIAASGMIVRGEESPPSDSDVYAFLTKPYTAEVLLKTLAAALR